MEQEPVDLAKKVDINEILDIYQYPRVEKHPYMMKCPSRSHNDHTPSCSCHPSNNTLHCFGCNTTFDTIKLYQELEYKRSGVELDFLEAVKGVLELQTDMIYAESTDPIFNNMENPIVNNLYQNLIKRCRPLMGYEFNHLHSRGIFLYDCYIYGGKVYTQMYLEKELDTKQGSKNPLLQEIMEDGTFYKGIAPILKRNHIQIKHNYFKSRNSIIYMVDYEKVEPQTTSFSFLEDTERHLIIKKSISGPKEKRAFGKNDFIWIADGVGKPEDKSIYVCEGIEDALSFVQNGFKAVSLNSLNNKNSFVEHLKKNKSKFQDFKFLLSFDHDFAGEKATKEMEQFFKDNSISYGKVDFPPCFHDINDYWVSKI